MTVDRASLHLRCAEALRALLAEGGESSLNAAYELGREALESEYGVLDLAGILHATLIDAVANAAPEARVAILTRAESFVVECYSPFEMAHRGIGEANAALRRIDELRETEVRRLAQELHDEAGQMLAAVHLSLNPLVPRLDGAGLMHLDRARERLREVESQLRRISHEMRPSMLDDLGLLPALRFLAEGIARRTGLSVRVKGSTQGRLSPPVETAVYRSAQEALSNAARHARASSVEVRIARHRDRLRLTIADDGLGFDPAARPARGAHMGLGLVGIRERLGPLGGTLEIRSAPGVGTELHIDLPAKGPLHVARPAG